MKILSEKIGKNYESLGIFSSNQDYRFVLEKTWDSKKEKISFITLNPESSSYWDSTLLICKEFSLMLEEGRYGGMYMLNLYPLIVSKTTHLLQYNGEMFDKNISYIKHCIQKSERVFCAWGDNVFRRGKKLQEHTALAKNLFENIQDFQNKIYCFGQLKSFHPCHIVPQDGGVILKNFLEQVKVNEDFEKYLYDGFKFFS